MGRVNKVVEANKNYSINGNAALVPKRRPFEEDEKLKELKKAKEEYLRNKKLAQNRKRARVMLSIVSVFVVGVVLIYRYSEIYTMQKDLITAQAQVDTLNKNNDDLHYQLAKYNNINYIQQKAASLNMVQPDKSTIATVNLNKQNIVKTSTDNSKKSLSILDIIMSKLF